MNTKACLAIFAAALACMLLSDFAFDFFESRGSLTQLVLGSRILSPRKLCQFALFLVIGFFSFPLVLRLFIFLQIRIGNAEFPMITFLQAHERGVVIAIWCCLLLGLCIALPDSLDDFVVD